MDKVWILRGIAIVLILVGLGLFFVKDRFETGRTMPDEEPVVDTTLSEFERCARGDNPILESYPRQCRWPNGTRVWE
jgi:hypothetical protein